MNNHLSAPDCWLKRWMLVSAWMYLLAGLAFVLVPTRVFDLINSLGQWLDFTRMPYPVEKFWLALSFSMMMTITALSYMAALDIRRYRHAVVAVLISKFVSSLSALVFFLSASQEARFFGYLVITVVDGSIFVITLVLFLRSR